METKEHYAQKARESAALLEETLHREGRKLALDDLKDRLTYAVAELRDLASDRDGAEEIRLSGKAEGAALALSYVEDALKTV